MRKKKTNETNLTTILSLSPQCSNKKRPPH